MQDVVLEHLHALVSCEAEILILLFNCAKVRMQFCIFSCHLACMSSNDFFM